MVFFRLKFGKHLPIKRNTGLAHYSGECGILRNNEMNIETM
jgi:hypothetical protein